MVTLRQIISMVLIVTILAIIAFLSLGLGPARLEIYVSTDGDDSWSGGSPSPGDPGDGPFATLGRAKEEVRALVADGLKTDVVVWIRGGVYYLPNGLVINPKDSGSKSHSIVYSAYPGEEVSIVGGVEVSGWQEYDDGVWWASIPDGTKPTQLFEEGWRLELARSPDHGYFEMEGPAYGRDTEAFVYKRGDIDPAGWDIAGGRVFLWPGHDWYSAEKEIISIDAETRTIQMGSDDGYPMIEGNRYLVRNILALMDVPGECQIDLDGGKVYCWPREEPIGERIMVISTARNVIKVEGVEGNPVRNVHFENLDLGICNEDVFLARGVEDCSIRFCRIENGGQSGVLIANHAQRVTVYGNLIRFNGLHGVSLRGLAVGEEDVNHHNVVENNHIHHCGELVGHGYGVRISQSGHNEIVHNDIHHMPRYGTSIKGMYYQWMLERVEGVTWENHYNYLHSRNNLLAYNNIHHVNLDSQDTGAMESWGPGRDNIYDHNLIHDAGNTKFDLQCGIYLDGASDYFTVSNNIIYGITGNGLDVCISAKGIGNRMVNNILVVGPGNHAAIHIMELEDDRTEDHEYTHNIFYFESEDGHVHSFTFWGDERIAVSDHNLFWKPRSVLSIRGGLADGHFNNWLDLFNGQFDQNSIIADPMFVDAGGRDFRLKPGSPALELGFKEIDTGEIGLGEDFPARLAEGIDEEYRIPCALIYRSSG